MNFIVICGTVSSFATMTMTSNLPGTRIVLSRMIEVMHITTYVVSGKSECKFPRVEWKIATSAKQSRHSRMTCYLPDVFISFSLCILFQSFPISSGQRQNGVTTQLQRDDSSLAGTVLEFHDSVIRVTCFHSIVLVHEGHGSSECMTSRDSLSARGALRY